MSQIVKPFRTNRETVYGLLLLLAGTAIWVVVVLAVAYALQIPQLAAIVALYLFYAVLLYLVYFISSLVYRAYAFGNMVLLGPSQFPQLHAMVVDGAREIGLGQPPRAFIYNSNGLFNAFARRILGGRFVFLTSALVDASSDEQVRFVIGHELGHHAAGHLNPWLNFLKLPGRAVPFLYPAYSRAREYTCDNVGAFLSKDVEASRQALQMLGCGCKRLNTSLNCDAFAAQEAMVPGLFGFLTEIVRGHPRLTRRVRNIRAFIAADR